MNLEPNKKFNLGGNKLKKARIGVFLLAICFGVAAILGFALPSASDAAQEKGLTNAEAARHIASIIEAGRDHSTINSMVETQSGDSKSPDPIEILPAPEAGHSLGSGWNAFHSEAIPTQCVEITRLQTH